MRIKRLGVIAGVVAAVVIASGGVAALATQRTAAAAPTHATSGVPRYQHIFYIMLENHSYGEIIGNTAQAPHLNALANEYGLATNYWGVVHPSEPNYVASIAGSNYNAVSDAPYQTQLIHQPYLGSQLEAAGLTWKTYQQSLPYTGFTGNYSPSSSVAIYASKHNPFLNFQPDYTASQWQTELSKTVPDTQLAQDLANNDAPNFAYIVPDQCHDMHGISGYGSCDYSDQRALISAGDTYVANTVQLITSSKTWQDGNNAIVITWDENDFSVVQGPSNIASAGGHVATIVIANHGPRGVRDNTAYNHYALLLTIEDAFHLGCLANSCPATGGVQPMTPLFRASGQ